MRVKNEYFNLSKLRKLTDQNDIKPKNENKILKIDNKKCMHIKIPLKKKNVLIILRVKIYFRLKDSE